MAELCTNYATVVQWDSTKVILNNDTYKHVMTRKELATRRSLLSSMNYVGPFLSLKTQNRVRDRRIFIVRMQRTNSGIYKTNCGGIVGALTFPLFGLNPEFCFCMMSCVSFSIKKLLKYLMGRYKECP